MRSHRLSNCQTRWIQLGAIVNAMLSFIDPSHGEAKTRSVVYCWPMQAVCILGWRGGGALYEKFDSFGRVQCTNLCEGKPRQCFDFVSTCRLSKQTGVHSILHNFWYAHKNISPCIVEHHHTQPFANFYRKMVRGRGAWSTNGNARMDSIHHPFQFLIMRFCTFYAVVNNWLFTALTCVSNMQIVFSLSINTLF